MIRNSAMCTGSELMCLKKNKGADSRFLCYQSSTARAYVGTDKHSCQTQLTIRRKLLDVKATCPTGSDRTGLKGT